LSPVSSVPPGTTHDYAIGQAGASIWSNTAAEPPASAIDALSGGVIGMVRAARRHGTREQRGARHRHRKRGGKRWTVMAATSIVSLRLSPQSDRLLLGAASLVVLREAPVAIIEVEVNLGL